MLWRRALKRAAVHGLKNSQQAIPETEVPVLRRRTCGGDHVRHQILKSLPEQEILRIEIEIQALPGDSRCLSDVVHGCFLEAVPQEDRCRGLALWRAWRPSVLYVHRSVPL